MADLKPRPVRHDHKKFLEHVSKKKGFVEAYESLHPEYELADRMLKARTRAGLTQDDVAGRMGTTKSAVSRLEAAGRNSPSLATLRRYAEAVGCELQIRLVRQKAA